MDWSDEGLVLGLRRHGETSVILELMTRDHGRHLGLVRGGRSRRMQPVLQPGNLVAVNWRSRIEEQLGTYQVEPTEMRTARLMDSPLALYGVASLATLLRLLPERDPHPGLYDSARILIDHMADVHVAPALFVRFEVNLLSELGFGLDLSECAATGSKDHLIYVSPRTGRAVGAGPGELYKDRLLALPRFLRPGFLTRDDTEAVAEPEAPRNAIEAGFALTDHFLRLHVFEPRGTPIPEERRRFIALATRTALEG